MGVVKTMDRLTRMLRLSSSAGSGNSRGEVGTTLVELMVAILILSIVVAMGLTMMVSVTDNTLSSTHQGVSSETVQVATQEVAMYVSSAVTPAGAEAAAGAPSLPCGATSSSADSITVANSYSMTFCAYPSVATVSSAQLYTVTIPSSTCRQSPLPTALTNGASGGYCTLEVIDESMPSPAIVYQQDNVWCSYTCQQADGTDGTNGSNANPTSTSTPALFTYYAGPSSGPALTAPVATSSLGSVTLIVLNLTVLSNVNPNIALGGNGSPGTTVKREIYLANLS